MSDPITVRVVESYRHPEENEFFFSQNPINGPGMRGLFDYLEKEHGIIVKQIPGWQLKSTVRDAHDRSYHTVGYGLRVTKI
jgi:hypothetical protein|tara:strand:- start:1839 stop:2081 length:243 start_codon:yes stop_codon:yes gene_type:complete